MLGDRPQHGPAFVHGTLKGGDKVTRDEISKGSAIVASLFCVRMHSANPEHETGDTTQVAQMNPRLAQNGDTAQAENWSQGG